MLQNLQDEFAEYLNSENEVTPFQNISIYQNNMIASLTNTLKETYKMIVKLVDEDFFRIMAKEYIHHYPSQSGNLHDYGEYFSDFVSEYSPVKHLPYLSEVANFEWACHLLQYASDAVLFDMQSLAHISPELFQEFHLSLHPASRLMQFQYPILRIVDLCKGEMEDEINLNEGGVNLLLVRRDFDIVLVSLSSAQFTLLTAFSRNETLGEALDATLKVDPEFKLDEHLPEWIENKTIVDVYL